MDTFAISNMAWTTILVAIAGYSVKKWIAGVESKEKENSNSIVANEKYTSDKLAILTKDTSEKLAEFTKTTMDALQVAIHENRDDFRERTDEIIRRIDKLSDHVATANGRTTKNELAITELAGNVKTQIALCKDRNNGRRATDKCGDVV